MPGVTAARCGALVHRSARAMRWGPFLIAGGSAVTMAAVPGVLALRLAGPHTTTLLRVAAISGAFGVAFLLDDPAARSTAVVPTSRLRRLAARLVVALPVLALWWAAILGVTVTGAGDAGGLPLVDLSVEAGAIVAGALGAAAVGLRRSADGIASGVAVPALLAGLAVLWFLPPPATLFVVPDDPRWVPTHHVWWALLIATALTTLLAGREPVPARRNRQ